MTPRRPSALSVLLASLGIVALVVALGTGATAAALITGKQIKNGSITGKDVKDGSLRLADVKASDRASLKGAPGAPGAAGAPGAPGLVRAYGRVAVNGTLSQSSAGVTVTRPTTGTYCIAVAGVDPTSTVAVVSPDYEFDGTGIGPNSSQSFVEYGGTSASCPAGALAVRTFVRLYTITAGDLTSTNLQVDDQPFTFLIP